MKIRLASGALLVGLVGLLSAPAGIAYASGLGSAFSDEGIEVPIEAALTGAHALPDNGSVIFRARYRDGRGVAPEVAAVIVDGWLHNLSLVSGEPGDGSYELALPVSDSCREYFFQFVDGDGVSRRYPASGSFLTQGEGGCPVGYLEESVAVGESQRLGFFMLSQGPGEGISVKSAHFLLRDRAKVRVTVHDVSGKLIRGLRCEELPAGMHDISWDGRDDSGAAVRGGVYFYRLRFRRVDETVAAMLPEPVTGE